MISKSPSPWASATVVENSAGNSNPGGRSNGVSGGGEVPAGVDHVVIMVEGGPERLREGDIQLGGDVDLGQAGAGGADQVVVGHAGGSVQDQRNVDCGAQGDDQLQVQLGGRHDHGVRAAHGHGQGVDSGTGCELWKSDGTASGTVLVRVDVGPDGVPTSVGISRSSRSRDLDRAAIEAVQRWRFRPAMADGRPTVGSVVVPIEFEARR